MGGEGVLHEYMFPEMAKAFSLSDDQVDAFQEIKETIQGIKENNTVEEIREMMRDAFTSAIDAALADDAITPEKADQMLERMEQMGQRNFADFYGRGIHGGTPLEGREGGILQKYMEAALADALGVSVGELQAMKEDGLNLKEYAEEQGLTDEELRDLMVEVNTNAINAALEDGAITQEQADWMLDALENSGGRMPFAPGFGGRHGKRNNGQ
jgi:hypothetical protein